MGWVQVWFRRSLDRVLAGKRPHQLFDKQTTPGRPQDRIRRLWGKPSICHLFHIQVCAALNAIWYFQNDLPFCDMPMRNIVLLFRVESEESNYRLWVGGYGGNATDSFSVHTGYAFSTVDRNNDEAPECCPCAPAYGGGWWFYRYLMRFETPQCGLFCNHATL